MAKKQFTYKGLSVEELKKLSAKEFAKIATARARKTINKGLRESHQILLDNIRASHGKAVKTHCRDMVVVPEMIGSLIKVHSGKDFREVTIIPEMVGHYLGEFSLSRNRVSHSSPGVGASRSSANQGKK